MAHICAYLEIQSSVWPLSPRSLTVRLPTSLISWLNSFLSSSLSQQANHHKFCTTMGSKLMTNEAVLSTYILEIAQLSADLAGDQGLYRSLGGRKGDSVTPL